MKLKLIFGSLLVFGGLSLSSCSKEGDVITYPKGNETALILDQEQFAKSLSKVISDYPEVATLLTQEAKKTFDNNTDVLYHKIKNEQIGHTSLRELLASTWETSQGKAFVDFENQSPLLNIFASDLGLFSKDLDLNNWDTAREIAVACYREKENGHILYLNGDSVALVKPGEIPAIPTFVVGTNNRVRVTNLRSASGNFEYELLHPAFAPRQNNSQKDAFRNEYVWEYPEGDGWRKTKEFDEEVRNSWRLTKGRNLSSQRSLVYYSPETGSPNNEFNECLFRFKVHPQTYYHITNDTEKYDPRVLENASLVTYKGRHASLREIVDKIWTRGAFTFSFIILTPEKSGIAQSEQLVISVPPILLFVMNPDREYRSPNIFRRTRFTYTLNPDKFESKWVYPDQQELAGKFLRISNGWDLEHQGLMKRIVVSELDKGNTVETTLSLSSEFLNGWKSNIGLKISDIFSGSFEAMSSYKQIQSSTTKYFYSDQDDLLGSASLYFRDPIIKNDRLTSSNEYECQLNDITTGSVTMTFVPIKNNR